MEGGGRYEIHAIPYTKKKKKKSQETPDFYTPVEIICRISEVINSSSFLPKGTHIHNLPYGRFLSLG